MTHTPGPWQFEVNEGGTVIVKDGNSIGSAFGQQLFNKALLPHEANARLIAAAPDLLEALDGFPIRENENDADYITLILGWWITSGSKALAKAEGRS